MGIDRLGALRGRTQAELQGRDTLCDTDPGQYSVYLKNHWSRDMDTVSGPVKFVLPVLHVTGGRGT